MQARRVEKMQGLLTRLRLQALQRLQGGKGKGLRVLCVSRLVACIESAECASNTLTIVKKVKAAERDCIRLDLRTQDRPRVHARTHVRAAAAAAAHAASQLHVVARLSRQAASSRPTRAPNLRNLTSSIGTFFTLNQFAIHTIIRPRGA